MRRKFRASKEYAAFILQKRQMAFNKVKQLIDQILEPQKWGFQESYRDVSAGKLFSVIYDSQWCRIRFDETSAARQWGRNDLTIDYGRLHAPNDERSFIWEGERRWAWWGEWYTTLSFLEGIPPQKAVEYPKPDFIQPYWEKVLQAEDGNAEAVLRMERAIWEHYGVRLFEVFDLRRPDLWELFEKYVEECYQIQKTKGWRWPIDDLLPPPWKIC